VDELLFVLLIITGMTVRFADSYVDKLFSERDFDAIYHLIGVREMQRPLPEEFWLFCRIFEWAPARSGVWQYYEHLTDEAFTRMSQALERFELIDIAAKYQIGKKTWNGADRAAPLDKWLESHGQQIHDAAFSLIVDRKDCLKENG
jgi:hypothetical protein